MTAHSQLSRFAMHLYNPRVTVHLDSSLEAVLSSLFERRDPTGWASETVAAVAVAPSFQALAGPFAAAKRRLRSVSATLTTEETAAIASLGGDALGDRGIAAMFRALLLLRVCRALPADERVSLVDRLFRTGDNDERVAILGTLSFLPGPADYVATAIEACRSNVRDVFVAIACENDYPARFFTDAAFNQMVMKALFTGVELARVRGFGTRINPDLRRMASDYAAERTAAGRPVPGDIRRILNGLAA